MTRTRFTISEASRITGKSRTTLRTYLKKGKLSCVEGHGDQRLIDASELTRVFGNDLDFNRADKAGKTKSLAQIAKPTNSGQTELAMTKQQLEREINERNRERERLEQQLDELHGVLKRTQEGHSKAMLLLESRQDRAGDWEKPLQALKTQVANHEKQQQELKETAKRRIVRLQKELEQERSKSFFQRLFG